MDPIGAAAKTEGAKLFWERSRLLVIPARGARRTNLQKKLIN
jgi:hypothetical protein